MALDGIVVASIAHELNEVLINSKIEKIHQPEADEIIIALRGQGKNLKLLLSSSSQFPRVNLTTLAKENPLAPPSFCMLLRKHLSGGRITGIQQPEFERIIRIEIEAYDELHVLKTKYLIIEIMGKHSNIILVEGGTNKILDSIKRVSFDISRYRQVLPGLIYQMPPSQEKANPLTSLTFQEFKDVLQPYMQITIMKGIYSAFTGISPLISREICYAADITENTPLLGLEDTELMRLFQSFNSIMQFVINKEFKPIIYVDEDLNKFIDFNVIPLKHLAYYSPQYMETVGNMLETFYQARDKKDRLHQRSTDLRKSLQLKLDRLYNKIDNLQKDLVKTEKAEEFKVKGDLITANIYQLKEQKTDTIAVINYYDVEMPEINIEIDKKLTPTQNAQKYYKQYNKFKTAVIEVNKQMELSKEEITYLENILISIEHATHLTDLEEIQAELVETGYVKRRVLKKAPPLKKSTYLRYLSSDGLLIYVGKNNIQNDEITFKIASKEDIWLHVKDMPGSHVVVKLQEDELPDQTLLEAATLAAFYSKGKNSSKVSVDYTQRKYVRKQSGAKPGMVTYDNFKTVIVDPDSVMVSRLEEVK